ncbi:MAG: NAD-dependent epimerase/dehydratase family protein [Actinomycetota bacterium]|nr:NAD-dependent epimerase/dehydratase family protein [Actinomycetota bacterium]
MRCLVTGGCGFVGSALIRRLLAESCDVVVVDDLSRGSPQNLGPDRDQVTVVQEDVRNGLGRILEFFQPQVIFHLAALHFIPDCDADPARCLQVNVDGTRAVLDATATLGLRASLVLASSAAVYAPADGPLREQEDSIGPVDVYGHSKRWAEELAAGFAARTGTAVGIARLFNVFGPGETNAHFIPSLICQLKAGELVRLGNLFSRRDYVFVDDVADALLRLARYTRDGRSATLNIGSGRAYTGHEVVKALAAFSSVLAGGAPVIDPSRIRRVDRPMLLADPARAQKLLGWTPRTSLLDGLQAAWDCPVGAGVRLS